jgi:hypothetical protein
MLPYFKKLHTRIKIPSSPEPFSSLHFALASDDPSVIKHKPSTSIVNLWLQYTKRIHTIQQNMGCSQSNQAATEQEQPKKKAVVAGKAPEASGDISNKLALGAGCYWGTEKYIVRGKFK